MIHLIAQQISSRIPSGIILRFFLGIVSGILSMFISAINQINAKNFLQILFVSVAWDIVKILGIITFFFGTLENFFIEFFLEISLEF